MRLLAISTIDPTRFAQARLTLTLAAFEAKGRIGVLLESLQYAAVPGEPLTIPLVLINQGLAADVLRIAIEGLPEGWATIPVPVIRLEPGEVKEAVMILQPPRQPGARAGRRPFRITVSSQQAPAQGVDLDATLTVAAFIDFKSNLIAAQPDQSLPAQVELQNLSNIPVNFQINWNSPDETLVLEPKEPLQVHLPAGESTKQEYSARLARRPLFGGEAHYPYTVTVQASEDQVQTLDGEVKEKGLLPTWAVFAALGVVILLCLCWIIVALMPGALRGERATEMPAVTSTAIAPLPTATQSQVDQRDQLIERNWYLVAFNDTPSSANAQEPVLRFNPDGTLVGFTGCKNLNAGYTTNFNQITVSAINLGSGACPDAALQQQEDATLAILRSARSYFIADTAMQIAGDAGFLSYSLSPVNRTEDVQPPTAVIQTVSQAVVGQVVVFDGSASSGQVPLVAWMWDFGDGATARGLVVQHTYTTPGSFQVRLTVQDQRAQTASASQQIHILAAPTPTALPTQPPQPTTPPEQPTYTPVPTPLPPTATTELFPPQAAITGPTRGYIGEPVEFDASATQPGSSPIISYTWSFGNGETSPALPDARISTIYNRAGEYEVTVFVADASNMSSYATTRITIDARLDTAVWTLSTMNQQPLLDGTAITAQFLNGELTGFSGCNTYQGRYTAIDNGDGTLRVVIENLTTSRLACPGAIMDQEAQYLTILGESMTAEIQENVIILRSPDGELVFYLIDESVR
jgi:heat shock protein HslJ